jgi:hypothetical protein
VNIEFKKLEHIADIGGQKEVNRVSWNGKPAKIDIRTWIDGGAKPGKGIALTDEEAGRLLLALSDLGLSCQGGGRAEAESK